eukprot:311613_1
METYGSIPSMDVIMKEENKTKNRCCIFCCVIVIIFIGLAGWTMTTWNFIKPNTLDFNDIWTSNGLKNDIVNELNHPLAIKAAMKVREILQEQQVGVSLSDHDFRTYYSIEKACCQEAAC